MADSLEARAWANLGAMLQRRHAAQPEDGTAQERWESFRSVPLKGDGQPDEESPRFPALRALHVGQIHRLRQPPLISEPGGAIMATEDETRLWSKDLALFIRDPDHEERRYFLRLPSGENPPANETPGAPGMGDRYFLLSRSKCPFVQALASRETGRDRLHVLLAGPKETFGHEVRLWLESPDLGQSFLWPANQGLWLPAAWHELEPEDFVSQALPWNLARAKPVTWNLQAAVGEFTMPLQATVELYPGGQWDAEFTLVSSPVEGGTPLGVAPPSLAKGLKATPSAWHVQGHGRHADRDLLVAAGRTFLSALPIPDACAGLTDFLRDVASRARRAAAPDSSAQLAARFSGGPHPQVGNGLLTGRWKLALSASPLYAIDHEVDFLPWLSEREVRNPFFRFLRDQSRTHGATRAVVISLATRGRLDLDWRFEGTHPGLPTAEGAAGGRVEMTLLAKPAQEFDGVTLAAGAASSPHDDAGMACRLESTLDCVAGVAFGPAVQGQFQWKGLTLRGGWLSRAGVLTGDPATLLGEANPDTEDAISPARAWPEASGVPQLIFA